MNKLIKGTLVMTNVADQDIEMYVKYGWKLEKKQSKVQKKKSTVLKDKLQEKNVKNTVRSDTIKK